MKIAIVPNDFSQAVESLQNPIIGQIIVYYQGFNIRNSWSINDQQLALLCQQNKQQKDIVVSFACFFHQDQIDQITIALQKCQELGIKTIEFHDYGIVTICQELNYHPYLLYSSSPLITNCGQIDFFVQNKINGIVLSRELTWPEIKQFLDYPHSHLDYHFVVEGNQLIMSSKWKLIQMNKQHLHFDQSPTNDQLLIKENLRQHNFYLSQNELGTGLYTTHNISAFEYLDDFMQSNLAVARIDCFMHNQDWIKQILEIYTIAFQAIEKKNFANVKAQLWQKLINLEPNQTTCGFLRPLEGLKDLQLNSKN